MDQEVYTLQVPLHKAHSWRLTCLSCGGHTDIGSGAIGFIEKATCSKCKKQLPLDEILPILKAAMQLCCNHERACDVSLLINDFSCDKTLKYIAHERELGVGHEGC